MAQTYEIDIERFNGTDYDKLLPTPATHAATHQADGTDPLTCQTGNYGDKTVTGAKMADATVGAIQLASNAVTTVKITDANVTRAKLANDALYSPVVYVNANRNLAATDLGATLFPQYSSSSTTYTITITQAISTTLPIGFEFVGTFGATQNKLQIATSGFRVLIAGEGQVADASQAKTFTISELGGMVAFKKVNTGTTAGDLWIATGNVEVV